MGSAQPYLRLWEAASLAAELEMSVVAFPAQLDHGQDENVKNAQNSTPVPKAMASVQKQLLPLQTSRP